MKEKQPIARGVALGRKAYSVLADYKFTTLAGTLVFFLIMSLVPFLFWLTLLFGRIDPDLVGLEVVGWASELLSLVQESAEQATAGVSAFFLITTLWSSTGFFYHLRRSGEIIYRYNRKKRGWKVRVSAVVLTFAVLFFFAFAGGLLVEVNLIMRGVSVWISYPVRYALALALAFFAAWILNAYICPYRSAPSDTALGSLLTAVAWLVASAAFSVYLFFSDAERLYGALSLIVVFLLWLYWMMIIFTAGVIFNRRRMQLRGKEHKKF